MKKLKIITGFIAVVILGIYLGNAAWLVSPAAAEPEILAHRGLHQTYDPIGVDKDTCTAERIATPIHHYIENTIASVQAAIDLGADIVEFDIHPTVDGEFVVFHDWELDCRTDGIGVVREQTLNYLKSLDVGFGYTADGGETYPLRGQAIGEMPTLGELLTAFPETQFLINIKSNDREEARLLTEYLQTHKLANRSRLFAYGSGENMLVFSQLNPDIKILSKKKAKQCLKSYTLIGWSGYVPKACHDSLISIPENYQWLVWGWPNRFEARMKNVNTKTMLMGEYKQGQANSGIDQVKDIPSNFGGIIFTNRIDIIGKWER